MTEGDSHTTGTWQRLVSTALVGVNRRAVPDAPDLPAGPDRAPAAVLLDRAAAATVQQRAGYVPETAEPLPPALVDRRPVVPDAAGRRLDAILAKRLPNGGDQERVRQSLLLEWLDLAEARDLRVPPGALTSLLEEARKATVLRQSVATVAGARGRWLAGFNKHWSFLQSYSDPSDTFDPRDWKDGTGAERRRALAVLRSEDPARARDLLAEVWTNEPSETRRVFLRTFEVGLSADDEPFLDQALDERGASVRATALALLARLPDSAHAQRLCAQAARFVRRDESTDQPHRVRVTAPEPTDRDLARDLALAVRAKGDRKEDPGREWLRALLTHTPLRYWTEYLDATPAAIVEAATAADQALFLAGLANAAVVQENPEWGRLLLDPLDTTIAPTPSLRGMAPELGAMLALLPNDERCSWVAARLHSGRTSVNRYDISSVAGRHWTRELGERVAEHIEARTSSERTIHGCFDAALCMPPAMHERFSPVTSQTHQNVAEMRATLRFRREMHDEFG